MGLLTSMLMKIISMSSGLRNRCRGFMKCCGERREVGGGEVRPLSPTRSRRDGDKDAEPETRKQRRAENERRRTKTCAWPFLAELVAAAKAWRRPTWMSVDEREHERSSIQAVEYYSAMNRSEALTLTTTWTDLEHTKVSERNQKHERPSGA